MRLSTQLDSLSFAHPWSCWRSSLLTRSACQPLGSVIDVVSLYVVFKHIIGLWFAVFHSSSLGKSVVRPGHV